MSRPKCAVENCMNEGLILHGSRFICGNCLSKIMNKRKQAQDKEVEDLI